MPSLARRLQRSAESATAAIFRRVAELRAAGTEVIALSFGEPDGDPPEHVRSAAVRAIEEGGIRYTRVSGLARLREAIVADSVRRRGLAHDPEEVVVSAGAKHALFNLAQALYDEGDEVLIPTPAWVSYAEQARLCGAQPVPLVCERAHGYKLQPEALARALGPRTKALVLCTPCNPTGAVYTRAELAALAGVLREHDAYVIVDEIYAGLTYDGVEHVSLLQAAPALRERLVVVDGVSKRYAMTGYRLGWMLGPRALAQACETVQSQATTSVCTIAQHAAIAALQGPQACVASLRDGLAVRRDRMRAQLAAVQGLDVAQAHGAFYLFVGVEALLGRRDGERAIDDDVALAEYLLDAARVATVPGSAFGAPGHLRLSYALASGDIDRACARIGTALQRLRPG